MEEAELCLMIEEAVVIPRKPFPNGHHRRSPKLVDDHLEVEINCDEICDCDSRPQYVSFGSC